MHGLQTINRLNSVKEHIIADVDGTRTTFLPPYNLPDNAVVTDRVEESK